MVINSKSDLGSRVVIRYLDGTIPVNVYEVDTDTGRMDLFAVHPDAQPGERRLVYARVLNRGRLEQLPIMERVWRSFDVVDPSGEILYKVRYESKSH